MAEFLNKKVGVEDDWWSASMRALQRLLMIGHHTDHSTSEAEAQDGGLYIISQYAMVK